MTLLHSSNTTATCNTNVGAFMQKMYILLLLLIFCAACTCSTTTVSDVTTGCGERAEEGGYCSATHYTYNNNSNNNVDAVSDPFSPSAAYIIPGRILDMPKKRLYGHRKISNGKKLTIFKKLKNNKSNRKSRTTFLAVVDCSIIDGGHNTSVNSSSGNDNWKENRIRRRCQRLNKRDFKKTISKIDKKTRRMNRAENLKNKLSQTKSSMKSDYRYISHLANTALHKLLKPKSMPAFPMLRTIAPPPPLVTANEARDDLGFFQELFSSDDMRDQSGDSSEITDSSHESDSNRYMKLFPVGDVPNEFSNYVSDASKFNGSWVLDVPRSDDINPILKALGIGAFRRNLVVTYPARTDMLIAGTAETPKLEMTTYLPFGVTKSISATFNGKEIQQYDNDTGMWTTQPYFIDGKLMQRRESASKGIMYDVRAVYETDPRGVFDVPVTLFVWTLKPHGRQPLTAKQWLVKQ